MRKSSLHNWLFAGVFFPLGILLLVIMALSLRWRMELDTPIMMYIGFMIDHLHRVPYRDFFDMNLPGSYALYTIIGKWFGYSDFALRWVDVTAFAAIAAMTWHWMRTFGWRVALCGIVLFGYLYFSHDPRSGTNLQREYFMLLLILGAVLVASSSPTIGGKTKLLLIGFLFGIAGTFKPHAIIGLPVVLFYYLNESRAANVQKQNTLRQIALAVVGSSIPLLAVLVYLWANGALLDFIDIATHYWPLYGSFTGDHRIISGSDRISYLFHGYISFANLTWWFIPSLAGLLVVFFRSSLPSRLKRQALLLAGLTFCYSMYALIAGQFWAYHWIPFAFFLLMLSSLVFIEFTGVKSPLLKLAPIFLLFMVMLIKIHFPPYFLSQLKGAPLPNRLGGRVDEIATFLQAHLHPGDLVQPLDWTGGAIHSMLIARAQLATPFIYDFHFYHHISEDYILNLRTKFLDSLQGSRPRYIIQIQTDKPWPMGESTSRSFPELEEILRQKYMPVLTGRGYTVFQRDDPSAARWQTRLSSRDSIEGTAGAASMH